MQTQLTFLQEDSRANPTQLQEKERVKKTIGISGRKCLEQYEKLNQDISWGKMFLELLVGTGDWYSRKCKLTWRLKGTKYKRYYFQLVPLTHRIEETEFGLLPTPTVAEVIQPKEPRTVFGNNRIRSNKGIEGQCKLTDLAMKSMLPTPTTRDYKGSRSTEALKESGRTHTNSLPDAFHQPGKTSQLNPQFVMEMMGFPPDWTELPFLNGETNQSKQEVMP